MIAIAIFPKKACFLLNIGKISLKKMTKKCIKIPFFRPLNNVFNALKKIYKVFLLIQFPDRDRRSFTMIERSFLLKSY